MLLFERKIWDQKDCYLDYNIRVFSLLTTGGIWHWILFSQNFYEAEESRQILFDPFSTFCPLFLHKIILLFHKVAIDV